MGTVQSIDMGSHLSTLDGVAPISLFFPPGTRPPRYKSMHLYSVALFKKLNQYDPDPFSDYLPDKAGTGQGRQGQA